MLLRNKLKELIKGYMGNTYNPSGWDYQDGLEQAAEDINELLKEYPEQTGDSNEDHSR